MSELDWLAVLLIVSLAAPVATWLRAAHIHQRIEALYPGFNARMRRSCRALRKLRQQGRN